MEKIECPKCNHHISAESAYCDHCGARIGVHKKAPWYHIHRHVYDWTLAWAYKPSAAIALFILSFAESSFFPIPPDVLLMPLVLGNRKKWLRYATICSIASVLGGAFGFFIGWQLWESHLYVLTAIFGAIIMGPIGWWISHKRCGGVGIVATCVATVCFGAVLLGSLGWIMWEGTTAEFFFHIVPSFTPEVFKDMSNLYERYNFWIVFTAGFTPLPFKLITITAGVCEINFAIFIIAAVVSRSARFFLVAGTVRLAGPKALPFIDKYFNLIALVFTILLVGGFVVVKYLF